MSTIENAQVPGGNNYARKIVFIGGFFFIFGFVTWLNGTLIPYLRIACELEEWESYLVTFAFYIAYTVMAIPSSKLLRYTGMVKGMQAGLVIMAAGCLFFIPSALSRTYGLFLVGLFTVGTGLAVLQTAVNPYITLLGPAKSAAQRISIMGVCNKFAGILAPLVLGAMILRDSDQLINELANMSASAREARLDTLARAVILPYCLVAAVLLLVAFSIRFARLPEVKVEETPAVNRRKDGSEIPLWRNFHLVLGFFAIFTSVGLEVVSGDTIGNYGLYHNMSLDVAKTLASYSLASGIIGYLVGVFAIPKFISQEKAYLFSNILGVFISCMIIFTSGITSVVFVALMNLANALLWPAVWPQALRGLRSHQVNRASAILIMGIAGGAIMPLWYGWMAKAGNNQIAYWILIPCYVFNMYYWYIGKRRVARETRALQAA